MIKIGQSSAVHGLNWENLFFIVAYDKGYWNNPKRNRVLNFILGYPR